MSTFKKQISRRSFIKATSMQLFVLTLTNAFDLHSILASEQNNGYSRDSYGQGKYPGNQTFLPSITKEGK